VRNDAHRRAGGAFSDAFARYVQEERVLTLGQAIQRMTSVATGGLHHVIVNGVPVVARGTMTGAGPDRALFGRAQMMAGAKW
jgi:hypothetical protein